MVFCHWRSHEVQHSHRHRRSRIGDAKRVIWRSMPNSNLSIIVLLDRSLNSRVPGSGVSWDFPYWESSGSRAAQTRWEHHSQSCKASQSPVYPTRDAFAVVQHPYAPKPSRLDGAGVRPPTGLVGQAPRRPLRTGPRGLALDVPLPPGGDRDIRADLAAPRPQRQPSRTCGPGADMSHFPLKWDVLDHNGGPERLATGPT